MGLGTGLRVVFLLCGGLAAGLVGNAARQSWATRNPGFASAARHMENRCLCLGLSAEWE